MERSDFFTDFNSISGDIFLYIYMSYFPTENLLIINILFLNPL